MVDGQKVAWNEQPEFVPPVGRARSVAPLSLPAPLTRASATTTTAEDRRGTEGARASGDAAKLTALSNFWHAKGLCFKCGEPWGHEHVCPPTVKLHITEELSSLFSMDMYL